jgi:16S rRNA (guanine966-N2)-methyltransferase
MRVIGGIARGRRLKTKKGRETRPTADRVKESLFNIIHADLAECNFLDAFAGFGGIGIEALSRGASRCLFIEKNRHCATIIKENLTLCGLEERGEVLQADVGRALQLLNNRRDCFNLMFFDPPYGYPGLKAALQEAAMLLAPDGYAVVEHQEGDNAWLCNDTWVMVREKIYGDTALTFLIPAAAAVEAETPDEKGGTD